MSTRRRRVRLTRDTTLFIAGLVIILNEALVRSGPPRSELLTVGAVMVGLPAFLRADERRSEDS